MHGSQPWLLSMQRIVATLLVAITIAPMIAACSGSGSRSDPTGPGSAPTTNEPTLVPATPAAAASPAGSTPPATTVSVAEPVARASSEVTPPTPPTPTTAVLTPAAPEPPPATPTPRSEPKSAHVGAADATATPSQPPTTVPSPTARRAVRNGRIFLGYYVPYDSMSWASLEANAEQLDYVAAQWTFLDACGNIGTQDNLTLKAFAQARGIGLLPSLFTVDGAVNHQVLTDEAIATRAIHNLVDYVIEEGYAGLDVDLEGVLPEDRPALTSFVQRLSVELRARGKLITMAVPPKASDAKTGWAGAYDYAALGPHVDLLTVMTYAYTIPSSDPGSTAPLPWVDRVIEFVTSQIPKEKVLVGVPLWGYDWNVTTGALARALRYPEAEGLARQNGVPISSDPASRSATFKYVVRPGDPPAPLLRPPALNHDIRQRQAPPCPVPSEAPRPTRPPQPTPTPAPEQYHEVWLEDVASFGARLELTDRHDTGGIGVWRLGQEDPRVWQRLAEWRESP